MSDIWGQKYKMLLQYEKGEHNMAITGKTIQERAETTSGSDLLTIREVARILRVDETTVRRWIKDGVLEAVALPHAHKRTGYRVKRETMDALFDTQQVRA